MLLDGLPPRFRIPLLFLLTKKMGEEDLSVVTKIEAIRAEFANRRDLEFEIYTSPNPDSSHIVRSFEERPNPGEIHKVSLNDIATTVSISQYWGTFLYLCANAIRARTILELGSCAGISGCYLASGKECSKLITIEGSPALAALAEENIRHITDHVVVVNALFDIGLDKILPPLEEKLDLVYVDGQHGKKAMLYYFKRLTPYLNKGSVVLIDDIYWSSDTRKGWQALCKWKGLACTINLGRCGVCVWDGEGIKPKNFDFSLYTDLWKRGKPPGYELRFEP
jgi:predicted O-methyltransferase YrrM